MRPLECGRYKCYETLFSFWVLHPLYFGLLYKNFLNYRQRLAYETEFPADTVDPIGCDDPPAATAAAGEQGLIKI